MLNKRVFTFFFITTLIIGYIYSRYLLSASMIALAVVALTESHISLKRFYIGFDTASFKNIISIYKKPVYGALTLIFFMVLFSFWQTYDEAYYLERLRIKIAFVAIPLIFLGLPKLTKNDFYLIVRILLYILVLTCFWIIYKYLENTDQINFLLKRGHPMPTPGNHIRFATLMVMGLLCGWVMQTDDSLKFSSWLKKLHLGLLLFLFIFLHVLAVRTGLLMLYGIIAVFGAKYIYNNPRNMRSWAGLALVLLLPILTYFTVPSLKGKVDYMIYDLKMYNTERQIHYSDSGRLISLDCGMKVWRTSPILGVGSGNIHDQMEKSLTANYPEFPETRMPHNQFVYTLASNGLVGLLLLLVVLFIAFYKDGFYRHKLAIGFGIIMFVSLMLEHSLENAVGVAFFLVFLLLLRKFIVEGDQAPA